mmetsp:Transcript_9944/g.16840  ORF Transcript_9944/g.16840 Transcript_9944/m.16840 type:complete len:95 (-) Transcript_9944:126-410(-)
MRKQQRRFQPDNHIFTLPEGHMKRQQRSSRHLCFTFKQGRLGADSKSRSPRTLNQGDDAKIATGDRAAFLRTEFTNDDMNTDADYGHGARLDHV